MSKTVGYIRVDGKLTVYFRISEGLKQKDGLSPTLLNLALEYIIRKTEVNTGVIIMYKSVQLTEYADDVDIMRRSINSVKEALINLKEATEEVGLKLNTEKTKVMLQK